MHKELSSNEIIDCIKRFHGHLGPYVVLGFRAGQIANRELSDDPFGKRAHTMTGFKPPISCFTDGVQLGSCCTLGKGNISVSGECEARVRFELKDCSRSIEIFLTKETLARIDAAKGWDESEQLACQMLEDPESSLFVVKKRLA